MTSDLAYKVVYEFKRDASAVTALIERDGRLLVRKSVLNTDKEVPSYLRLQKQHEWLRLHQASLAP